MARPQHNLGLDLVRTAAILLVMFSHTALWWMPDGRATEISTAYAGRIGVELFFSLSGFLIGGILLRAVAAGFDAAALRRFWARRWLRTLPAYWALLLLLDWHFGRLGPATLDWRSLVFLQSWVPRAGWTPLTSHTWSLVLEEWFYLFVPPLLMAVLAVLGRRRRDWAVPLLCAALVAACTLGRAAAGQPPHPFWGPEPPTNPVLRLDCAAWGLLAAWLVRSRPMPAAAAWALLAAGPALLAVLGWMWAGMFAAERLLPWGFAAWGPAWAPVHPALEELGAACLVLGLHRLLPRGPVPLAWPAGAIAGISYALYLVHVPVLYLARTAGLDDGAGWAQRLAVTLLVLAAAVLVRVLVEVPALRLRDHVMPGGPRASQRLLSR